MKIYKETTELKQIGTACDVCGKQCDGWDAFGTIYSLRTDCSCEFCEDCWDRAVGLIKGMGGVFRDI